MLLNTLKISNIRNLPACDFHFSDKFNLIYGKNGSGKTATLEAINMLSLRRSFRNKITDKIISLAQTQCVVHGTLIEHDSTDNITSLGFSKTKNCNAITRINSMPATSIAQSAQLLPIQLINSDSFDIVNSSPQYRREFLDWGLFHVEHKFFNCWQRFKRALKQRNACLKDCRAGKSAKNTIIAWDPELITTAEELDKFRAEYLKHYIPLVIDLLQQQMGFVNCNVIYHRGWDPNSGLQQVLSENLPLDLINGSTRKGPHRAELEIIVDGIAAKDFLSRGQMKKLICTMMIARARVLQQQTKRSCLFLIDDLPSELDVAAGRELIAALDDLGSQVLLTGITKQALLDMVQDLPHKLFHVEQYATT